MANSTTLYTNGEGRNQVDVTLNKVLTLADCGIVQNVIADGITVTLPATTAAASFTVRNGGVPASSALGAGSGADQSVLVSVNPNSADQFAGMGVTATDNKPLLNTKATSKVGDQIELVGDGTNGWIIRAIKGTWVQTP